VPVIQHRVSVSILCALVRPKKAVGLESLIGSWLALEPTLSNACAASGAERVEHHRVMKPSSRNHQLGWSRYPGSQAQNPSRSEAGLDASDNIYVPTKGKGRIFFLTPPFIGSLTILRTFEIEPLVRLLWVPQLKLRFPQHLGLLVQRPWGTNWGTHKNFRFPGIPEYAVKMPVRNYRNLILC
jgi:hypothetical protein